MKTNRAKVLRKEIVEKRASEMSIKMGAKGTLPILRNNIS
jgi:hypothetical protein